MFTSLLLFIGCGNSSLGPYEVGLQVVGKSTRDQTTIFYRMFDGGDPIESIGLVGTGTSCPIAENTAGSRSDTFLGEEQLLLQVVGETELGHPLVPNSEEFATDYASVVQFRQRSAGSRIISELNYDPETLQQFNTTSYVDDAVSTNSGYYAVAADEYVAQFSLDMLWHNVDELEPAKVDLMTRNNPEVGDVWSSFNGNILYIYEGEEVYTVGGVAQKVDVVSMYETSGLRPDGADVFEQCLNAGQSQLSSDDIDIEQYANSGVFLDSGCEGDFTHAKVGTQWWYNNILVKEESTTQQVVVNDYGYEWFVADPNTGACARQTAKLLTDTSVNARMFVEYSLTTVDNTFEVTKWTDPQ